MLERLRLAEPDGRVVMSIPANATTLPGDILLEDFLRTIALSQNGLARAINVPPRRINEIVLGKRQVTADTDLRLTRYFGLSEGFFLGLQSDFDLLEKRRQIAGELEKITPRAA